MAVKGAWGVCAEKLQPPAPAPVHACCTLKIWVAFTALFNHNHIFQLVCCAACAHFKHEEAACR
jgi:hypothetical protein